MFVSLANWLMQFLKEMAMFERTNGDPRGDSPAVAPCTS
jgi:hypothetical protein